jgi:hypothetical protein
MSCPQRPNTSPRASAIVSGVLALELVVTLGLAVLTGSFAASRRPVATPVLLLVPRAEPVN